MFAETAAASPRPKVSRGFKTLRGYLAGLGVIAICTFVSIAGAAVLQTTAFAMVFPLAVLLVTVRFGVGPAVLTAVVGVFVFDYVVLPPALEFTVPNLRDGLTLVVMLAVAGVAGVLAEQLRRQVRLARRQAGVERLRNALLSSLSHDLRTPLSTLVGLSTALCEDRFEQHERRELTRVVADEAARLRRLVDALLELTRIENGRSRVQSLEAIDEVIGSALRRLQRQLEGRPVRTKVPEDVPLVGFDAALVEQVIINLIENVLRHAGSRSPVDITARMERDALLVEVADRGPGVPPGDEEKVFDKLYRAGGAPRNDGGVGLGLTICRAIVAAHAGRIWLENRPGGGASVIFTLPIAQGTARYTVSASDHPVSEALSP